MPIRKIIHHISKVQNDWRNQRRGMSIHHEISKFTKEFRRNFFTLLITAFGLVAALSWQDVIKEWISISFPDQSTVIHKTFIAIVVSIFFVIVTYFLSKKES